MEPNRFAISDMVEPENSIAAVLPPQEQSLSSACDRLLTAEKLLLNPNPQSIEHAGFVLQQALSLTEACNNPTIAPDELADFRAGCSRVKILLEGALRAQWAYIHRMSAATSTYTAGPAVKCWSPRAWTLCLEA